MVDFVSGSAGEGRLSELTKKGAEAILVGTYLSTKEKEQTEEHLNELVRLGTTYGIHTALKIVCPLRKVEANSFLGKGKVQEIADFVKEYDANIVIFDDEISPQQQRNLEKSLEIMVIDRTELILGIFAQRAHTKEARLQVQLAQFQYQLPRLRRMWTHLSRQRVGGRTGKGGFLKGEGERQIELDRRILRERIDRLRKDIKTVQKQRETQRAQREKRQVPSFAIIGYTNAGKSTLLNALTDAKVFVEDKLFATLDTTTRKFKLPNNQNILLIDTVGFIRKLPHHLIASFKSTLEEAVSADILIHLIDASSSAALEEIEATYEILKEMKSNQKPILTVLNKTDLCSKKEVSLLKYKFPKTIEISALKKKNFELLLKRMVQEIKKLSQKMTLSIDQKHFSYIGELLDKAHVLSSEYVGNNVVIKAEVPKEIVHKFIKFKVKKSSY